ncbi:MAG TPA: hypothetical protein VJO35_08045 [Terriglobales bacterium]|nr:hypothetical protein [Terriglobales bacterium]
MPLSEGASDNSHIVSYERLQRGPYYADFRRDRRLDPEVYHCVIQCQGSSEILRWTQHHSLDEAIEAATTELAQLLIRHEAERQMSAQSS